MDDVLNKNSKCNIGFGTERSEDDTLLAGKGIGSASLTALIAALAAAL